MILITGGFGFLGSFVAAELRRAGLPHCLLDNLSNCFWPCTYDSPFFLGDLCDPVSLDLAFRSLPIESVIHLAALTGVRESIGKEAEYNHVNVIGTQNLMEAMHRFQVRRLVVASSSSVYADHLPADTDESAPLQPLSPYGFSKLQMEQVVSQSTYEHGITATILRFFNLSGSCTTRRVGETWDNPKHLIPQLITAAKAGKSAPLFGLDHHTPDGSSRRAFTHVGYAADAVLRALRMPSRNRLQIFNVSGNLEYSTLECWQAVEHALHCTIPKSVVPRIHQEKSSSLGSSRRAWLDLGLSPSTPTLEALIATSLSWLKRFDALSHSRNP